LNSPFIYFYYKTEPTRVLEHFLLDFLQLPPPIYLHAARDPRLLLLAQELGTPSRKYPDQPHLFASICAEFASKAIHFQDSGELLEKMKPSR
jgi:hypothetical protein